MAEVFTLTSLFLIRYISEYLEDPEDDFERAAILVASFSVSVLIGTLLKNFYIYYGYMMSLDTRKLLCSAMYDKVGKLSMRSLTETNSGKLITLVSADIFTLERSFSMAPFVLCFPFINLACYGLIWHISGWPYAVTIFGLWIIMMLCQMWTARLQKSIK